MAPTPVVCAEERESDRETRFGTQKGQRIASRSPDSVMIVCVCGSGGEAEEQVVTFRCARPPLASCRLVSRVLRLVGYRL